MTDQESALEIYLSPININPPNCKISNSVFQSKHALHLPEQDIFYYFNNNTTHDSLPEWHVINPFYNITNNNENYTLNNFHMHYPAEHPINNIRHPLEIHFVFYDLAHENNALVVGYLFQIGNKSSKLIQSLLKNTPIKFPTLINNDFCTYNGSLTKINLEDIHQLAVNWNLLTKVKTITQEDLTTLIQQNMTRNASVVRQNNGRNVTYIHTCNKCKHV